EIVCGHRRFRAAKIAKERTIRATVSTLTDAESARLQTIENLQREDLDPIEAAEGYSGYIRDHGVTKDQLADHIKKSRTYVYNQLKLISLCEIGRIHVRTRALDVELAIEIARLPTEELQLEALDLVCYGDIYPPEPDDESDGDEQQDADQPVRFMGFREGRERIEDEIKRHLSDALFDRTVIFLVPERPDCQSCPERAGNIPELEATGKRADICTNPGCFDLKAAAHLDRLAHEAGKDGGTVIPADQSKALFLGWDRTRLASQCGYLPLDTPYWEIENKTPRDALGKKLKPKDVVHIVSNGGNVIQTVTKETLTKYKVLEEEQPDGLGGDDNQEEGGGTPDTPQDTRTPDEIEAEHAAGVRQCKVDEVVRSRAYPATVQLVRSAARQPGDITAILYVLFELAQYADDNDETMDTFDDWLREHNAELASEYESWCGGIANQERRARAWTWIQSIDGEAQATLCMELALFCCPRDRAAKDASPDLLMTVARSYGLDEQQIRADVEAEVDEEVDA
ncbi:ParB/RepB/Spo0J family partition protein, partial [Limnobacter sp.]|uniref:ParB/RepB/Spo0J family partition protein n=1 Tax=Limnobacter sp. TaxID=2003368 RepID=UPI00273259FC